MTERQKAYLYEYAKKYPEKVRAWKRKYKKSSKAKEAQRRYRSKDPTKNRTHGLVNDLIRRGKLTRLSCLICGIEKTEAHHEDYRKPLEIMWLCAKHHQLLHKFKKKYGTL